MNHKETVLIQTNSTLKESEPQDVHTVQATMMEDDDDREAADMQMAIQMSLHQEQPQDNDQPIAGPSNTAAAQPMPTTIPTAPIAPIAPTAPTAPIAPIAPNLLSLRR